MKIFINPHLGRASIWLVFTLTFATRTFSQSQIIPLYNGPAPGSEAWDWSEKVMNMGPVEFAYNIVKPSLIVFQPDSGKANGKAVIICPGGGFYFLSMNSEGYDVAIWLSERGYTAFVLKYRTEHCFTGNPMQEFFQKQPNTEKFNKDIEPIVSLGIADGKAAVAYVREHAEEWDIKTDQVGIIGFSAGGTVTTGVAFTYDGMSRPDFVAPIYPYVGSFGYPSVPDDAPPMFIAGATDDTFGFQTHCTGLYEQWTNAKKSAELHIYRSGGHGFGMQKKNIPTDGWIDRFHEWLKSL